MSVAERTKPIVSLDILLWRSHVQRLHWNDGMVMVVLMVHHCIEKVLSQDHSPQEGKEARDVRGEGQAIGVDGLLVEEIVEDEKTATVGDATCQEPQLQVLPSGVVPDGIEPETFVYGPDDASPKGLTFGFPYVARHRLFTLKDAVEETDWPPRLCHVSVGVRIGAVGHPRLVVPFVAVCQIVLAHLEGACRYVEKAVAPLQHVIGHSWEEMYVVGFVLGPEEADECHSSEDDEGGRRDETLNLQGKREKEDEPPVHALHMLLASVGLLDAQGRQGPSDRLQRRSKPSQRR